MELLTPLAFCGSQGGVMYADLLEVIEIHV